MVNLKRRVGVTRVVIYLDIILIMNLVFNYFLLLLTNYLARAGMAFYRLLIGAMIATSLVPIYLYFPESIFHTIWMKGVYSLLIILFTFGYKGLQSFCKMVSLFYFTTIAIGGGLFAVHYMMQEQIGQKLGSLFLYANNMNGEQVSVLLLVMGFPACSYFIKRQMDRHVKDKINYDQMYEMWIEMYGKCIFTTGYIDSGNQLVDPLSNRPVVICDATYIREFFDEKDWQQMEEAIRSDNVDLLPEKVTKKLFIIPYQGVEGQTGFLYTLKPDRLGMIYHGESLSTNKVLVGIQLGRLTRDDAYHCLLHPGLIQLNMTRTA